MKQLRSNFVSVYILRLFYPKSNLWVFCLRKVSYNQNLGRFNRADSFEGFQNIPLSRNQYIYGNGNPVTFSDPSGQFAAELAALANEVANIGIRLAPPLIQASNAISKLSVLQAVINIPLVAYIGMNAALAISARLRGGTGWTGTLTGAQVPFPVPIRSFARIAGYRLNATTTAFANGTTSTFTGDWFFALGGLDFKTYLPDLFPEGLPSAGQNGSSHPIEDPVTLYTPSVTPAHGGSFAGAVVFLSLSNGFGTPFGASGMSYQTFIAGSGFGEIVTGSRAAYASLSGLVGLSIYKSW